ncbi:hypothetical protein GCM10022232_32570 [Streptomyces plumbiresistens]|uniref:Uncharacterized protein n=2 Tax=Streptomyces TaxID=1883 RepID=A0ABP7R8H9_9ACTN
METSQQAKPTPASHQGHRGHTMYEYEISQLRSAELIRQAEQERLAREALRGRRAARREAARRAAEGEVHTGRPRRHRFPRTA